LIIWPAEIVPEMTYNVLSGTLASTLLGQDGTLSPTSVADTFVATAPFSVLNLY